jgi:hypothetical protein
MESRLRGGAGGEGVEAEEFGGAGGFAREFGADPSLGEGSLEVADLTVDRLAARDSKINFILFMIYS